MVAFFGVDDLLHFGQLFAAESFFGQAVQQLLAGVRGAPESSQFGFVIEDHQQFA